MLNQEIKELKDQLSVQAQTISAKDAIILDLQNENMSLQNNINSLRSTIQRLENEKTAQILSNEVMKTKYNNSRPSMEAPVITRQVTEAMSSTKGNIDTDRDGDVDDEVEFIYNPTAAIDNDGHLPQIRRKSLSEEEEKRMEMEAVHNVIFNDSKVNNMNMNIINNHNHHSQKKEEEIESLKNEIDKLNDRIDVMMENKRRLARNTAMEMDRLRSFIKEYAIR